jgi:hypothetical protein
MEMMEHASTDVVATSSPAHWHFKSLPREVQRATVRRLAMCGLREEEIAAQTGLSVESVRVTTAQRMRSTCQATTQRLRYLRDMR